MIIDNFDEISKILTFSNQDEFYFVQIIQRKKDGNSDLRVSSGFRLIRSYYIYSLKELEELKDRIVELCISNNARAYINPNVRNANQVALECSKRYIDLVQTRRAYQGNRVWDSICGSCRAYGYKALWIVDVDEPSNLDQIRNSIMQCRHNKEFSLYEIPTVHGFHIVCNGFDVKQFQEMMKFKMIRPVDIHKDNPTLLYYNDLSSK